jgi:tetratricopeptide (TPR) repeat protein
MDIQQKETLKDAVVDLNTKGLRYLQNGDFRRAATSFLTALQDVKVLLAQMPSKDAINHCRVDDAVDKQLFASIEIQSKAVEDSGTIFSVYNRCLVIPNRDCLDAVFSRNEDMIPCILLYNAGLCFQIQSLETGSNALAAKALGAYEIALTILTRMPTQTNESLLGADGLLLLLAIINNAAALESHRFNLKKSARYSDLIRQLLENQEYSDVLVEPMFDFFVIYVFLTPKMCRGCAPAA